MSNDDRDDARARILARRQSFLALALASTGLAGGCDRPPHVCLSMIPNNEPERDPDGGAPSVDISTPTPPSATAQPTTDPSASASVPVPTPPRPTVCLSIVPTPDGSAIPRPTVCLSMVPAPAPTSKPKPCLSVL